MIDGHAGFLLQHVVGKIGLRETGLDDDDVDGVLGQLARRASLKPWMANLLAEYSLRAGMTRLPATEEMLTMAGLWPAQERQKHPGGFGHAEEVDFHQGPQPLGAASTKWPVAPMPALLISTSRPPYALGRLDHLVPVRGTGHVRRYGLDGAAAGANLAGQLRQQVHRCAAASTRRTHGVPPPRQGPALCLAKRL